MDPFFVTLFSFGWVNFSPGPSSLCRDSAKFRYVYVYRFCFRAGDLPVVPLMLGEKRTTLPSGSDFAGRNMRESKLRINLWRRPGDLVGRIGSG